MSGRIECHTEHVSCDSAIAGSIASWGTAPETWKWILMRGNDAADRQRVRPDIDTRRPNGHGLFCRIATTSAAMHPASCKGREVHRRGARGSLSPSITLSRSGRRRHQSADVGPDRVQCLAEAWDGPSRHKAQVTRRALSRGSTEEDILLCGVTGSVVPCDVGALVTCDLISERPSAERRGAVRFPPNIRQISAIPWGEGPADRSATGHIGRRGRKAGGPVQRLAVGEDDWLPSARGNRRSATARRTWPGNTAVTWKNKPRFTRCP